ncbi:MAG: fluoride efflux transporter CrcB [Bryobacteraceae bacterium]
MNKYVVVMLGGALGAVSRFAVGTFVARLYSTVFPLGTFLVNVSGSLLIGILMMLFLNRPAIHANWRLFLVTGILGGYTTFSSFEWETFAALRGGAGMAALLNVFLSVGLGLAGVWIGAALSNRLWPR